MVIIKKLNDAAISEYMTFLFVNNYLGRIANGWCNSQNTNATKVATPEATKVKPSAKASLSGGIKVKPNIS